MPIRVQMPNGTVRPFREGTPKSVIQRAQADMLADMKASGHYDDCDFGAFDNSPKRKVIVTQNALLQQPDRTVIPATSIFSGPPSQPVDPAIGLIQPPQVGARPVLPGYEPKPKTLSEMDIANIVPEHSAAPGAEPVSSRGFVRLPRPDELEKGEGGAGYDIYGNPPNDKSQWATPTTMQVIESAAARLAGGDKFTPFNIGNMSLKDGQAWPIGKDGKPEHQGHRDGGEFDVRPPRIDGANQPSNYKSRDYDLEATQRLVDALLATGRVKRIYFNDPRIKGVTPLSRHDDHLHVETDGQ